MGIGPYRSYESLLTPAEEPDFLPAQLAMEGIYPWEEPDFAGIFESRDEFYEIMSRPNASEDPKVIEFQRRINEKLRLPPGQN